MKQTIVHDEKFQEVLSQAVLDPKNRLSLGKTMPTARIFKVYQNEAGQILLDPQVLIPEREAWFYKKPERLAALAQSIEAEKKGNLKSLGSFKKYLDLDDEA